MFLKSNLDPQVSHFRVLHAFMISYFVSGAVVRSRGEWPLAFFMSTSTPLDRYDYNTSTLPEAAA